MMMRENDPGYYVEYIRAKGSMKVTAIDPVSGVEATIIVPAHTRPDDASQLAVKKLQYLLRKKAT